MKLYIAYLVMALLIAHDKAPARLHLPPEVTEYLHQYEDLYTTITTTCVKRTAVTCADDQWIALVAFYDTREARDAQDMAYHLGTGLFEVDAEGTLGRILKFWFPDGSIWQRGNGHAA